MSVYGKKGDHPIKESETTIPESFYGISKMASENYIRLYEKFGIQHSILRLFNVFGPGQNMNNLKQGMVSIYLAQMIRDKKIIVKGSKDRFRDFIYIDDVIDSFINCIKYQASIGKTMNIANGKKIYVSELLKKICRLSETEIQINFENNTPGDIHGIYADVKLSEEILGDSKKIDLDEGIKRFFNNITNN